MQVVKQVKEKPKSMVEELLKRKYEGVKIAGFDEIIEILPNTRDAKEATKLLMPLLRQKLVLVNPEHVETVEIVERRGEVAIEVRLLSTDIVITRNDIEVMAKSIITYPCYG